MKTLTLLLLLFLSFNTHGAACEDKFSPISKVSHVYETIKLCYTNFFVEYLPDSKVSLYAAEKLTREVVLASNTIKRKDQFHAEQRIPRESRAYVSDYKNSGYDKGHLVPDRNYPGDSTVDSLVNIAPQAPSVNRGQWKALETRIREVALTSQTPVYVITGVVVRDSVLSMGNGKVSVPTKFFKIVFVGTDYRIYMVENVDGARVYTISHDELRRLTGASFLK